MLSALVLFASVLVFAACVRGTEIATSNHVTDETDPPAAPARGTAEFEADFVENVKKKILSELGLEEAPTGGAIIEEVNEPMLEDMNQQYQSMLSVQNDADENDWEDVFKLGSKTFSLANFCGGLGYLDSGDQQPSTADQTEPGNRPRSPSHPNAHAHIAQNLAQFTFNFTKPLRGQIRDPVLWVHSEWIPVDSDAFAFEEIIFLVCSKSIEGKFQFEEKVFAKAELSSAPVNDYHQLHISDMFQNDEFEPLRFALVIHGEGMRSIENAPNVRPYVHFRIKPSSRPVRAIKAKLCSEVTDEQCCLDVKTIELTAVTKGLIQRPRKMDVHFCRGECAHPFAGVQSGREALERMLGGSRPAAGDLCCVATSYNPVTITRRGQAGERVIEVLRNVDARDCDCKF